MDMLVTVQWLLFRIDYRNRADNTLPVAKRNTLKSRIKRVLHLTPSDEPDFKIEQIIKSRESDASTWVCLADGPSHSG